MADLPHPWGAYARIQQQLSSCTMVGQRAWGLEAALNILLSRGAESVESELSRTIATAERRHRHRRARLRHYAEIEHEEPASSDPVAEALGAEQILQRIRSAVAEVDWFALNALAEGNSYAEIADILLTSNGALRVRVARVRSQISSLAA